MTDAKKLFTHPVLQELALPLPLTADTSWTMTRSGAPGAGGEQLRIALEAGGDLIIEMMGRDEIASRYVFDEAGELVSVHQPQADADPLLQTLRRQVLNKIRACCVSQITFP